MLVVTKRIESKNFLVNFDEVPIENQGSYIARLVIPAILVKHRIWRETQNLFMYSNSLVNATFCSWKNLC
jgi:hypothetical protein